MKHAIVAFARVLERRIRTSERLRRAARDAIAFAARRSRTARDFVRIRLTPLV